MDRAEANARARDRKNQLSFSQWSKNRRAKQPRICLQNFWSINKILERLLWVECICALSERTFSVFRSFGKCFSFTIHHPCVHGISTRPIYHISRTLIISTDEIIVSPIYSVRWRILVYDTCRPNSHHFCSISQFITEILRLGGNIQPLTNTLTHTGISHTNVCMLDMTSTRLSLPTNERMRKKIVLALWTR